MVVWPKSQATGRTPLGGKLHKIQCPVAQKALKEKPDDVDFIEGDPWYASGFEDACKKCLPGFWDRTSAKSVVKQASVTPEQIKTACWSKGFFELMADVFGTRGNDPVHGACRLVMEALAILMPYGEKMATILDRGSGQEITEFYKDHQPLVQHYVLKVGNMYLDGNGAHSAQEITTDEELGGWREIPNLIIPATPALIEGNRSIACPPGAAQRAADYIQNYSA